LVRCDLHGEPHKAAIEALGLSRRQFYRERQEALLQLAQAIEAELARTGAATVSLSLGDAAEAYIEALRAAGQYRLAWRESRELAASADGDAREVQLWSVACEAARYVGDHVAAAEALDYARRAASGWRGRDGSYARTLWVAIGEMNQYWAQAECERVRQSFEAAVRAGRDESTLNPNEAKLFGIMLGYMAAVECDCGRWEEAERLYARERRLAGGEPSATTRSSLLRLSARIADARGDRQRAIAEHRSALEIERQAGQLGPVAVSAVYYAAAIGESNPAEALPYAEYGLEITRRYYPGDRLAKLTLHALPVLLDAAGPAAARRALAGVRRGGLGVRDALFVDAAEARIAARAGDHAAALERGTDVAARLAQRGFAALAETAELVVVESYAKLGQRRRARRHLENLTGTFAGAESRERARRLGTALGLAT
ncbi:MAG TPA: hypothetical protein VK760_03385, partial [Candidatus Acidoferrales bacterium]|nr:hypothetical protein [Candidatus Acidoferrales bacterium]